MCYEVKEGVQCMLVTFFARKAAWLKTKRIMYQLKVDVDKLNVVLN